MGLEFTFALMAMKHGGTSVTREAWPKGHYVFVAGPFGFHKLNLEKTTMYGERPNNSVAVTVYAMNNTFIKVTEKSCSPWTPTHEDLLANDWTELES